MIQYVCWKIKYIIQDSILSTSEAYARLSVGFGMTFAAARVFIRVTYIFFILSWNKIYPEFSTSERFSTSEKNGKLSVRLGMGARVMARSWHCRACKKTFMIEWKALCSRKAHQRKAAYTSAYYTHVTYVQCILYKVANT